MILTLLMLVIQSMNRETQHIISKTVARRVGVSKSFMEKFLVDNEIPATSVISFLGQYSYLDLNTAITGNADNSNKWFVKLKSS